MSDSFWKPDNWKKENSRKDKEHAKKHEEYLKRNAAEIVARSGSNHNLPEHIVNSHASPKQVAEYKLKNNWPKEHELSYWDKK